MDRNIQDSKEYRLAKEWEMAVNSYSFDPRKFAAAIPDMHPTLQQSLYRLIRECIKVMADDSRRYDDRNRASHEEAKCIMEYLNEHGKYIPLLIGSTELLDALQPGSFEDVNEGFASEEAEDLYDEVFYFTKPQNLLMPDKELIEVLKESNPDWFE